MMTDYMNILVMVAIVAAPVLFPMHFWRDTTSDAKKNKPSVMYFSVFKKCENPYTDDVTAVSWYDAEDQHAYHIENVHDNDAFTEMCAMLTSRLVPDSDGVVYLVTYDTDFNTVALQNMMANFFEDNALEPRFVDLKQLFYFTHPLVPKIVYADLVAYFKVPSLENKPLEYAAIFEQLMQDFDLKGDDGATKSGLNAMYTHLSG